MENASKALLIAGAILLSILIIAIGMFIYNSAQSTITDSINTLSTQEVEAFNNQFLSYEGVQKGSNIKNLMGKLVANANTYSEELEKIPVVFIGKINANRIAYNALMCKVYQPGYTQYYIDNCGQIRNRVEANHEYYVEINYQKNGLIDVIFINYDINNPDPQTGLHRNQLFPPTS